MCYRYYLTVAIVAVYEIDDVAATFVAEFADAKCWWLQCRHRLHQLHIVVVVVAGDSPYCTVNAADVAVAAVAANSDYKLVISMTMDTDIDVDDVDDTVIVRDLKHETNAFDCVADLTANPSDMVLLWVAVMFEMNCVSYVVEVVAVGSYY